MKTISIKSQVSRKAIVLDKEVNFIYEKTTEEGVKKIEARCEILNPESEQSAPPLYPVYGSGEVLDSRYEAIVSVTWRKNEPSSMSVNARKPFAEYTELLTAMEAACIEVATDEELEGGFAE